MLRDHLSYDTTFFRSLEWSLKTGLIVHLCTCVMNFKSTNMAHYVSNVKAQEPQMQTSAKAAHYQHSAQILDLESQYGDPDHKKNFNQLLLVLLQSYPENFINNRSYFVE